MINNTSDKQCRKSVEYTYLGGPFCRVRFSCSCRQGTNTRHIETYAKMNARPSALVKLAERISEILAAAVPDTFAPKVELTRLPPAP